MIRKRLPSPKARAPLRRGSCLDKQHRAMAAAAARILVDEVPFEIAVEALLEAGLISVDHPKPVANLPHVTKAEQRVLVGILSGKTAAMIADDLCLSVHTIHNHTRKIFAALGVRSRAKAIVYCLELGVTAETLRSDS